MSTKILIAADTPMSCPDCGSEFPLHNGVARTAIDEFRRAHDAQLMSERAELTATIEAEVKRKAGQDAERATKALEAKLEAAESEAERSRAAHRSAIERLRQEAEEKAVQDLAELSGKLEQRDKSIKILRDRELKLLSEREDLEAQRQELALQVRREVAAERERIQKQSAEEAALRDSEFKKKIEDAQRANADLKRKLEQGSQQLQGEVLELQLEEVLRTNFPFDDITEVKKGARGADVMHIVRTRAGQKCGSVIWEAKRAEHWSDKWISKLKDDQHEAGASIAVLVSSKFPDGLKDAFVLHDGVWIVRPDVIRPLAEVLRTVLLESARRDAVVAGRHEKAEALYDYLCSHAFAQRIRGVVDAYTAMQDDLNREKSAMQRLWKKREQQVERIAGQMMGMCGELQGIAQDSLPELEGLGELALIGGD